MSYEAVNPSLIAELKKSAKEEELGGKESPDPKPRGKPFKKGKSGNPLGRPKGAKNKTTLVREAVQAECTDILYKGAPKVIQAVIEQAQGGCKASQKLVWNSLIANKKAAEDGKGGGPATVTINIEGIPSQQEKVAIDAEIIEEEDGQFQE
jgi:hypothetical protein